LLTLATLQKIIVATRTRRRTFVLGFVLLNVTVAKLFWNFYATKAIKTSSLKKRNPRPPCRFAWKFQGKLTKFYYSSSILIIHAFWEICASFWKLLMLWRKSTKFFLKFCGHDPLGILALVDTATLSCFNHDFFYKFWHKPLALLSEHFCREKFSSICVKEKFLNNAIAINYHDGTQATTHCCLEPYWWESLHGWDFRPQLIVVSGLFGGKPFVDGILGHNLLLSQAF
jgi:hypothetical protein